MKEIKVKYALAIVIIGLHLLVILSIIFLRLINGFSSAEFTTLFGIVTPIFTGYSTSIIAFIIRDRHRMNFESRSVTGIYVFLLFSLPTLFVFSIILSVWLKAYNITFKDFEDFKSFILTMESIFALFTGMLVYSLFPKKIEK